MAQFTDGELEVMRILWEGGEMKPPEIQAEFPRPIKNPALRSYLTILVEKGHLVRRRMGKAYYYRAKTRKDPTFRSMFRDMVDTFFDGSTEALLCRLIKAEDLSDEELLDLRRLADKDQESGRRRGRRKK